MVVLKVRQPPEVVRIGTKVITRSHLCKGQQSVQLKVADSLLKPPRNNSRRGRNVQTELKSTVKLASLRVTSGISVLVLTLFDRDGGSCSGFKCL